ncbi:olfactory receptor 13C7-like [Macaca mulatta]
METAGTLILDFLGLQNGEKTTLFTYGKPKSKDPLGADKQDFADKLISLSYGVATPMLNTIIYSLRNKGLKAAVRNLVFQKPLTE